MGCKQGATHNCSSHGHQRLRIELGIPFRGRLCVKPAGCEYLKGDHAATCILTCERRGIGIVKERVYVATDVSNFRA